MLKSGVGFKKSKIKFCTKLNKIVSLHRQLRIGATLRSDSERQLAHDSR